MITLTHIREATALYHGIESDPKRLEEVAQHHKALLTALNASHTPGHPGEQDALTVFEAIAMLLGQLIGGADDRDFAHGLLTYTVARAEHHSLMARANRTAATHVTEAAT